jgi:fatty acid-binding protein DegV
LVFQTGSQNTYPASRQVERDDQEFGHLGVCHWLIGAVETATAAIGDAFSRQLLDPGRGPVGGGDIRKDTRSRRLAYQAGANKVKEILGKGKARIAYIHAGVKQEPERLKQIVESKVEMAESFAGELSPALAVHSGPSMAGLCYCPMEL